MNIRISRRAAALLVSAVAVAIGGSYAYASIPDSAGVIHGCYDKNGLRVIDPVIDPSSGAACKNNETSLDWSQSGPQGPPGQDGTDGTNGADGVSGYELVTSTGPLPGGDPGTGQIDFVSCPAGKKVTGGGVTVDPHGGHFAESVVRYSGPLAGGSGWTAFIQRTDDDNQNVSWTLWAICASVS
jgi:hypothetical protein